MGYNPYEWGDTTPLVKSGYEARYAKLLTMFPFNKIEKRTVDGQEMTFFPKTYCKVNNTAGAGRTIIFAPKAVDSSYKLMTCFYDFTTGAEVPTGVCHARYIASKGSDAKPESKSTTGIWGSIPYTNIRTKARLRGSGWNPLNIWDYHYRGLLMLMETLAMGYTGADVQTAIGGSDGSMDVTHYGITNVWGGTDKGFWIHGLDTYTGSIDEVKSYNNNLHIVGKDGVRRDTGILCPSGSNGSDGYFPVTFQTKVTDQYDMNELLVGNQMKSTSYGGFSNDSCGDAQQLHGGGGVFHSSWGSSTEVGPFYLGNTEPIISSPTTGFALRKAV